MGYECGDSIHFELCRPSCFRSKVVARGEILVSEALSSQHRCLELELRSVAGASNKALASLSFDLRVSRVPLSTLGVSSLRENPVSDMPTFRKELLAGEVQKISEAKAEECERFISK